MVRRPRAKVELRAFDVAVQRYMLGHPERSILLSGLRGVGKTVLLRECERIAAGRGWGHESFEAGGERTLAQGLVAGKRDALLRYSRTAHPALGKGDSGSPTWT